jgi:outer membrane protein assembly factor BamB
MNAKILVRQLVSAFLLGCSTPAMPDAGKSTADILPMWQTDLAAPGTGLGLAAITMNTVIVAAGSTLVGLEVRTGAKKWSLSLPFILPDAGLVMLSDSLATLVTGDGFVVFDPNTGIAQRIFAEPRPRKNPSGTIPQVLSDGRVLYASRGRELLALDVRTGRLDTLTRLPGDSTRRPYVVSLAVVNDTIYSPVASDARRGAAYRNTVPYRFSVRTRLLDSLQADASDSASLSSWMISNSGLLVSSTNYSEAGWLAYDRTSGARRWKVNATAGSLGPSSQVAVVGDTMFAGGNDGVGYVIRIPTGQLIRTLPIPNGLVAGVVACGHDVVINVIGEMFSFSRDGVRRRKIGGLTEGKDAFLGSFASGGGIAVIGNGAGLWMALPCAPAN